MIFSGQKFAQDLLDGLKQEFVQRAKSRTLALVAVGANEETKKFIFLKKKAAEYVGVGVRMEELPENASQEEVCAKVKALSDDASVDGVLVELPLPEHIDAQTVLDLIDPVKDVDVLSTASQGAVFTGRSRVLSPAVEATRAVLAAAKVDPHGKHAVVFGFGSLVGRPIATWLAHNGATVTVVTEHTAKPTDHSLAADIIVGGAGKPKLIKGDMVKQGAVVIDFGYTFSIDGIVGDVDAESVAPKAALVTPVPGGVGPLVVVAVLRNLLALAK